MKKAFAILGIVFSGFAAYGQTDTLNRKMDSLDMISSGIPGVFSDINSQSKAAIGIDSAIAKKETDVFVGEWHCLTNEYIIKIQKVNDYYLLEDNDQKLALKIKGSELYRDVPDVHIIYNAWSGHIFYKKKEYQLGNFIPAPGKKVIAESQPAFQVPVSAPVSFDIILGADFPVGLVKDNLTGGLATEESVLLKFTADDMHTGKMIFLDHIFHMADLNSQYVANSVFDGLMNTGRVRRIAFDKYAKHYGDTIFYIISYSDIQTSADYVPRQDANGNQLNDYVARTSCKVTIADYFGNVICSGTFKHGEKPLERIHLFRFETAEDAIKQSASKLSEKITNFFMEKLPVVTTVLSVESSKGNGDARTILVKGGEKNGITEQTGFKIMYKNKQIGAAKVRTVGDKTSVCKVQDGGDVISAKIAAGKTVKAVSE